MHLVTIAEAHHQAGNLEGALDYLLRGGFLTPGALAALARQRLAAALLPVAWYNALVSRTARTPARPPVLPTNVTVDDTVREIEVLAPSNWATPSGELERKIYGAALRGLTLGEMARRLPMRWDLLTRTATALLRAGSLRRPADRLPRVMSAQLKAGQMAPDFCLPDLTGGEQRLSDLRGELVWLIFNRQSACPLCSPHNAQLIAMHERLRRQGVQIVTAWGSPLAHLGEGIGKLRPPYPVLRPPRRDTQPLRPGLQPAGHAGWPQPSHGSPGLQGDGHDRHREKRWRGVADARRVPDRA